jgi:methionine sulfoxide reductase heme-binding subunit
MAFSLSFIFFYSRSDWNSMHSWNRAFADVALSFLIITMILGPLGKIHPVFQRFLSWRRELGIWCTIMVLLHLYILFKGWFYWEPIRLIIGVNQATGQLDFDPGFTLANLIGFVGLIYLLLLSLISNNRSIIILGQKGWDHLQRQSGTLYIIVILHTTFFLYFFRFGQYNWLQKPFLVIIAALFILKWTVFVITVRRERKSRNQ